MKIDIMTLFPEMINAVMRESIIGRAQDKGVVEVKATNIRDYALDKHHKADDAPYGGGRGQVMLAEPLYLCHQALSAGEHVHTVFLSAQGQPFNQQKARELLAKEHFILVCGHYEGIDQRFIDECVDEEISIGDFVLTGGEIPAMAVADAVCRMVPGVLPSISLASSPIALILFVSRSKATTEGSFSTTPLPLTYTRILAVPKSIPISVEIICVSFLKRSAKIFYMLKCE